LGNQEHNAKLPSEDKIMDWEILFDEKENILSVKTHGVMDTVTHKAMIRDCLDFIKQKSYHRLLIDNREITSQNIGTFDIHSIPQVFTDLGFPSNLRIAEVAIKKYAGDFGFLETVCRNRGFMVSAFYDIESALQWLKQ